MSNVTLSQLPLAVRLTCAVAFFAVWVAVEKIVIEPFALYRFMPFYRVDGVCVWDLGVALVLLGLFVILPMRQRDESVPRHRPDSASRRQG
jgi:hypothetical protein